MLAAKTSSDMCSGDDNVYLKHNARVNKEINKDAATTILENVAKIQVDENNPFVVCDYGAASGVGSMGIMTDIIEFLQKKYGSQKEVQITYEDQPSNDFNSLFLRLNGCDGYLKDYSNVFVSGCGRSFYNQCVPSNTVHLGISIFAVHYLSKLPCEVSDSVFAVCGSVPEEQAKFTEQASRDWELFLMCREKELKPGGCLVIVSVCKDENSRYSGFSDSSDKSFCQNLSDIWKSMMEDGTITKEEFQETNKASHPRSADEFRAPFDNPVSPVFKSGLKIKSLKIIKHGCPFHSMWSSTNKSKDETEKFAEQFVSSIQYHCRSVFMDGLSNERLEQEKNQIVDECFRRYTAEVLEAPEQHSTNHIIAYIVIEKNA